MTLCNNLSLKMGVGLFLRVGILPGDYDIPREEAQKPTWLEEQLATYRNTYNSHFGYHSNQPATP